MDKALIFDIQGFSVHDGPGSRTLIFFAGCPLRCAWCSNPEGLELKQKVMFVGKKCKRSKYGCTRCVEVCPHRAAYVNDAEEGAPVAFDREACDACTTFECVHACYAEALKLSGTWMTRDEVQDVVLRDRKYWSDGGGVTFSGGEALMQHEFVREIAQWCKAAKINTAIETTAYAEQQVFLDVMQHIDFAFIDIKHMDSARHREKTGVGNELILDNITALVRSGWPGRLIIRMPAIRGYNDTDENIRAMADFMNERGLYEANILPFHRLGDSKYTQLGKQYAYADETPTPEDKLEHMQDLFLEQRIACYVAEGVMY